MKMKIKYIIILLLVITLSGCENFYIEDGEMTPIPSLSQTNYKLEVSNLSSTHFDAYDNLERTFSITNSEGVTWEITGAPDWLSFSPSNGGGASTSTEITMIAQPNLTDEDRNAEIIIASTVKDWPYKYRFTVNQPSSDDFFAKFDDPQISFNNYSEEIPATGKTIELSVITNCSSELEATAYISTEAVDCSYNKSTNKFKIVIPANPSEYSRTIDANLKLNGETLAYCRFSQLGGKTGFVNSAGEITTYYTYPDKCSAFGETITLKINSSAPESINVIAKFRNESYSMGQNVSFNYDKSLQEINVSIPENTYTSSREILVELRSTDGNTLYGTAYITQVAPGITLFSGSTMNLDSQAQSFEINFESSADWTASTSSDIDWVTFSSVGGMKGKNVKLTVSVSENLRSYSRTCYIYLKTVTGNKQCYVQLTQNGVSLQVSTSYFAVHENVADNNGKLTITASAPWSIKSSPDWATITPASGKAGVTDATLKVDYQAWVNGMQLREGDIVLQIDGTNTTQSIKVRQYY